MYKVGTFNHILPFGDLLCYLLLTFNLKNLICIKAYTYIYYSLNGEVGIQVIFCLLCM